MVNVTVELLAQLRAIGEAGLRKRANELAPRLVATILSFYGKAWPSDHSPREAQLMRETVCRLTTYTPRSFEELWAITPSLDDPIYAMELLGKSDVEAPAERGERGRIYRISWPVWRQQLETLVVEDQETFNLLYCRLYVGSMLARYKCAKEGLERLGIDPGHGTVFEAEP